jgi:hypothetical protein
MVISDESVSGQVPTNSSLSPVSEYEETIPVPTGEVYYVESVAFDEDGVQRGSPNSVDMGITAALNGFSDIGNELIGQVGRKVGSGSPGRKGVLTLGEYAYGGDTIGLSFDTPSDVAPHYRLSIRRVL